MKEICIEKTRLKELIKENGGHDRDLEIIENIFSIKYKEVKIKLI